MDSFKRDSSSPYALSCGRVDVNEVCNQEKCVPLEWIIEDGADISKEFIDYALPLIQGNPAILMKNGLPGYAYRK